MGATNVASLLKSFLLHLYFFSKFHTFRLIVASFIIGQSALWQRVAVPPSSCGTEIAFWTESFHFEFPNGHTEKHGLMQTKVFSFDRDLVSAPSNTFS